MEEVIGCLAYLFPCATPTPSTAGTTATTTAGCLPRLNLQSSFEFPPNDHASLMREKVTLSSKELLA